MTAEMLAAAAELDAAGLCVVPVLADGTKAPAGSWQRYIARRSTQAEHLRMFAGPGPVGIGVVYGGVSGNVELIEAEGRAVREGVLDEIAAIAEASGLADEWRALTTGWVTESPSGGLHFRVRVVGAAVRGNTKLASRLAREDELTEGERRRLEANPNARIVRVLVETRGEGGFGVVEPSGGTVHPTGRPWRRVAGSPAGIPTIEAERVQALRDIIRMADRVSRPEAVPVEHRRTWSPPADGRLRPGDDFEARTAWSEILTGWTHIAQRGRVGYWRRPGKDRGGSATTGYADDRDRLFVFTSSTEFEQEVPYTKFGAYALLNHGGDHVAAARALAARGYGTPPDEDAALARRDAWVTRTAEWLATLPTQHRVARALHTTVQRLDDGPDRDRHLHALMAGAVAGGLPLTTAALIVDRALHPAEAA